MRFGSISISYENAPIEVREATALSDTKKMELYAKLTAQGIRQSVILSTCGRSEVYFMLHEEADTDRVLRLLADCLAFDISSYVRKKTDDCALQHIFSVASGLDSMLLGEDQILGQVRDAWEFSRVMGCSGKQIEKIFREAITLAKKLKTNWKISEHPRSLSYIGIRLLHKVCGIENKRVLVLGSGKMAQLAIRYAYAYHASHVANCNRSRKHAEELQREFSQLDIYDFEKRYELLEQADIVISATASPHLVLQYKELQDPPVMLDLAVPRDIDPRYPLVYNIDSLKEIADEQKQLREQKAQIARQFVTEEAKRCERWLCTSQMDDSIHTLQEQAETIASDAFEILERRLDLTKRERHILKKTLHASMMRLIHEPVHRLKEMDDKETQKQYHTMIDHLFGREGKAACIYESEPAARD